MQPENATTTMSVMTGLWHRLQEYVCDRSLDIHDCLSLDNLVDFLTKLVEGLACQRMSDATLGYALAPPIPAWLKFLT